LEAERNTVQLAFPASKLPPRHKWVRGILPRHLIASLDAPLDQHEPDRRTLHDTVPADLSPGPVIEQEIQRAAVKEAAAALLPNLKDHKERATLAHQLATLEGHRRPPLATVLGVSRSYASKLKHRVAGKVAAQIARGRK
jgi:hypothetical protein